MHRRSALHIFIYGPSSGASWAPHKGSLHRHQPSRLIGGYITPARLVCRLTSRMACRRGYINLYSLYIAWLASAIFIHMPSFESLGLDVRADVSMLLVTFVVTLGVLGVMHGVHDPPPSFMKHASTLVLRERHSPKVGELASRCA